MSTDPLLVRLADAEATMVTAQAEYEKALRAAFPAGTTVTIRHYRGAYHGEVTGIEAWAHRVIVRNLASGKISTAYPSMTIHGEPAVVVHERPEMGPAA